MTSYHNLSYADVIYQGRARNPGYNKDGKPQRGMYASLPSRFNFGAVVAPDRNGLVTSVDPASGATLTLNGALVTAGVGIMDTPRCITIYATTDEHTKSILATGTDVYGQTMTETIAGPTGNGAIKISSGKKAFKTVTSLVTTGDFGTIEVGSGSILGLPFAALAQRNIVPSVPGSNCPVASPVTIRTTIAVLGTAETRYIVAPISGVISAIMGVGNANGSTATATITAINTSASASASYFANPVIGTMTYTTAYTAGSVPTTTTLNAGNGSVNAGDIISIATDGGGDSAAVVEVSLVIEPMKLVIADATAIATSSTGDVRGTVDIGQAADGTKTIGVILFPDRNDDIGAFGVTQA